jgi:hypothetical protein
LINTARTSLTQPAQGFEFDHASPGSQPPPAVPSGSFAPVVAIPPLASHGHHTKPNQPRPAQTKTLLDSHKPDPNTHQQASFRRWISYPSLKRLAANSM